MRREGRLPCPCDPSDLANFGHARPRCQSSAQAYGIVPFITLGLPEAVVRNGRGDFITYIVHPSMTMMPTLNTQGLKPACAHVPKPLFLVLKDGLAHKAVPDDDPPLFCRCYLRCREARVALFAEKQRDVRMPRANRHAITSTLRYRYLLKVSVIVKTTCVWRHGPILCPITRAFFVTTS